MKVLQINTVCGAGSTGVIAVEIADFLKSKGHESVITYGNGSSNYPDSFNFGSKFRNKIHALYDTRILGLEGYGSKYGTHMLLNYIEQYKPDIVHLHTLHGNFLNFPMLFKFLGEKRIPVVWSLFDTWAITGKCTHFTSSGCTKWQNKCGACPQLHTSGAETFFFDRTQKILKDKIHLTSTLHNLHIIVCSNWLKWEVEKSHLKNRPIHMIYNWIDTAKFYPIEDKSIYDKYGLDRNKKILVSVSAFWNKLTTRFEDAKRLADILTDDYQLVIVGKKEGIKIPDNIIHIPYVNGTEELSKLYTEALAFVGFSIEDTFGKVFAEAMLCGTPCVVFDSTACPEVVGDCGYAVAPHDVRSMFDRIKEIDNEGKELYSQKCIQRVKENFGYEKNIGKYLEVYKEILEDKS